MKNKLQLNINGKLISYRYNPSRQCFESNFGYKDNYGSRQSRVIRGKSVDELKIKLEDFSSTIKDNDITSGSITFQNYFDFYIKNIAPQNNRQTTITSKINTFKNLPANIRSTPINKLTSMQLQLMYSDFAKKYKINTIKGFHQLINTVLNSAVKNKLIRENPNNNCIVKGYQCIDKLYLNPQEITKFLNFLKNHKKYGCLYKPILFIAYSGCRKGEAIGLKKSCIDVNSCVVTIQGQITFNGFSNMLKTKSSNRKIKLPKSVIDIIVDYDNNSEFCFTMNNGNPFESYSFNDIMRRAAKEYGLPITAKVFRNSLVKTAIMNSVPLKVVQNILGHSKLSTTADIYGDLKSEDTYFTAEIIEKAYNLE